MTFRNAFILLAASVCVSLVAAHPVDTMTIESIRDSVDGFANATKDLATPPDTLKRMFLKSDPNLAKLEAKVRMLDKNMKSWASAIEKRKKDVPHWLTMVSGLRSNRSDLWIITINLKCLGKEKKTCAELESERENTYQRLQEWLDSLKVYGLDPSLKGRKLISSMMQACAGAEGKVLILCTDSLWMEVKRQKEQGRLPDTLLARIFVSILKADKNLDLVGNLIDRAEGDSDFASFLAAFLNQIHVQYNLGASIPALQEFLRHFRNEEELKGGLLQFNRYMTEGPADTTEGKLVDYLGSFHHAFTDSSGKEWITLSKMTRLILESDSLARMHRPGIAVLNFIAAGSQNLPEGSSCLGDIRNALRDSLQHNYRSYLLHGFGRSPCGPGEFCVGRYLGPEALAGLKDSLKLKNPDDTSSLDTIAAFYSGRYLINEGQLELHLELASWKDGMVLNTLQRKFPLSEGNLSCPDSLALGVAWIVKTMERDLLGLSHIGRLSKEQRVRSLDMENAWFYLKKLKEYHREKVSPDNAYRYMKITSIAFAPVATEDILSRQKISDLVQRLDTQMKPYFQGAVHNNLDGGSNELLIRAAFRGGDTARIHFTLSVGGTSVMRVIIPLESKEPNVLSAQEFWAMMKFLTGSINEFFNLQKDMSSPAAPALKTTASSDVYADYAFFSLLPSSMPILWMNRWDERQKEFYKLKYFLTAASQAAFITTSFVFEYLSITRMSNDYLYLKYGSIGAAAGIGLINGGMYYFDSREYREKDAQGAGIALVPMVGPKKAGVGLLVSF